LPPQPPSQHLFLFSLLSLLLFQIKLNSSQQINQFSDFILRKVHMSIDQEKHIKCVVILVAMEQEAAPMIEEFKLVQQADICNISKCLLYSGEFSGCALHLVSE
jgi:hypothetical protein